MSTAGFDLAEAHVLRDRHRKKVKMEQEQASSGTSESETVKSSCCLFWGLLFMQRRLVQLKIQKLGVDQDHKV